MSKNVQQNLSNVCATYRVQLNNQFRFNHLKDLVNYFDALEISHLYFSPIFKAKNGSIHCYDITDYNQINPDIGSPQELENLVEALHLKSLGIILDIVPNHMYIGNNENAWWNSVLEKGQSSPFASFFDIDWHPSNRFFENKICLPILDRLFGEALEKQIIKIGYDKGNFFLYVKGTPLPTDPESWNLILVPFYEEMEKLLVKNDENLIELKNIINELKSPNISLRIQKVFEKKPEFLERLNKQLETMNGIKNCPFSFNSLENFLEKQHYRLCYWRLANEEINYRRFFDILEFASIRVEDNVTFEAVHALTFELIKKKWVNGLRIDHIDGLWDPQKYLEDLGKHFNDNLYIIAEKILTGNEKVHFDSPMHGIVGYDFLNQVNGLFVMKKHKQAIVDIYETFTGQHHNIGNLKYSCKKLILNTMLASELNLLTIRLNTISGNYRHSLDFTFDHLKKALMEIIAYFPIYRTYIRSTSSVIHVDDLRAIKVAIKKARRSDTQVDSSIYNFIEKLLILNFPEDLDVAYRAACYDFVMHFQQVTGPAMAKGYEDTALYQYFPLSSLNEVGSNLSVFGISKEIFHKKNLERFAYSPNNQLTTTTHDTKRSEDVRARINLLSEIPEEWGKILHLWSQINRKYKIKIGKKLAPSANEEYLLYQTLLGTCPFDGIDEKFIQRIKNYMQKATSEAKINNNWLNPNKNYDEAINTFVKNVCTDTQFLASFNLFSLKIFELGMLNSLSQLILKLTSPGIPDVYQGNECWDFSLVDPDNRRPIDFSIFKQKMDNLKNFEKCLEFPRNGLIKFFVTKKILELRKRKIDVFNKGIYLALTVEGENEECVIAYARIFENSSIITLTSRFFTFFMSSFNDKSNFFSNLSINLPDEISKYQYKDIFSDQIYCGSKLELNKIFAKAPFAILESL